MSDMSTVFTAADGTVGAVTADKDLVLTHWVAAIAAIGALGTAASGLVDSSKAFWGGASRFGFSQIDNLLRSLLDCLSEDEDSDKPLTRKSIHDTLFAHYINGRPMVDQRAIAKSLIKMRLTEATAVKLVTKTGVDPDILKSVAIKINQGLQSVTPESSQPSATNPPYSLNQQESNVFGRFDLMLTVMLDEAYQHADQMYRNKSKVAAMGVSVAIAWLAAYLLGFALEPKGIWIAIGVGLIATPLAPIAKDLSTSLQAAAKALQAVKSKP